MAKAVCETAGKRIVFLTASSLKLNFVSEITVSLPDGSARTLPSGSTAADLSRAIGERLAKDAVHAEVNGRQVDLAHSLSDSDEVRIFTKQTDEGLHTIRHSTAHVLAQAVLSLFPGSTFAIGPPIEHGFYYDFSLPDGEAFSSDDLERIEAKMREIIAADQPFEREETTGEEALKLFAGHEYKREIISTAANTGEGVSGRDGEDSGGRDGSGDVGTAGEALNSEVSSDGVISTYRNSDEFVDVCLGPHVPSTGKLGHFALQSVAGAYWRGDHTRPMLQRIYGTAWASEKDLKTHLHRLKEAEKRDHRKLARDLDLLSWPDELGPGLAVWHPRGAVVRSVMEEYSRQRHRDADYELVYSPHLAKSDLWETSGHLDFFAESMYPEMELEGASYYPKPMNCPFHVMVYKSSLRSYRELPLRLFELGTVYRYELSGALHGLLRTRGFTQDDSHIFCTPEQIANELAQLLEFVLSVLRAFGFHDFSACLATKPPGKAVGDDSLWEAATEGLRSAMEASGLEYEVEEGGGAFYGPKIDVHVTDAIGRGWQLSTLQLDFNLPERFDLEFVAADGSRSRPVMIHRALFGSVERFFGVLLEHYGGALPVWLSPVQARVLPVAKDHSDYACETVQALQESGIRADLAAADDPLGKRIRAAKLEQIPYVLVVGADDMKARSVGVNSHGNKEERDVPLADLISRIQDDLAALR